MGSILYSLNDDWNTPMGVAFEGLNANMKLFPAITDNDSKVSV